MVLNIYGLSVRDVVIECLYWRQIRPIETFRWLLVPRVGHRIGHWQRRRLSFWPSVLSLNDSIVSILSNDFVKRLVIYNWVLIWAQMTMNCWELRQSDECLPIVTSFTYILILNTWRLTRVSNEWTKYF